MTDTRTIGIPARLGAALLAGLTALVLAAAPASAITRIGGGVDLSGDLDGDINVVGGNVTVDGNVDGNINMVGGNLSVSGSVTGGIKAIGGNVDIDATVGRGVSVAGGDVEVSANSVIGGDIEVAGGSVRFAGIAEQDFEVAGGDVEITGLVYGDVEAHVRDLRLGPNARISGNLIVRGPERPEIDESKVNGSYEYEYSPSVAAEWDTAFKVWGPGYHHGPSIAGSIISGLWALLGGIILIVLFPNLTDRAVATLSAHPFRSLGLGFLSVVFIPVLAIFLIATIIGLPFGLIMLVLYPILLFFGYLAAAIGISRLLLRNADAPVSKGQQILYLAVTLIVLMVLSAVPLLGSGITIIALLTGVGALGAAIFQKKQTPAEAV